MRTFLSLWKWNRKFRFAFVTLTVAVIATLLFQSGILGAPPMDRVASSYEGPTFQNWLGTDLLGRDVLSRVFHGMGVALSIGFIASAVALPIGTLLGLAAGFGGGRVDAVVTWLTATIMCVPQILLLLGLGFVLGKGRFSLYVAVGLTSWVGVCRIVRAEALRLRESGFMISAQSLGVSFGRLLLVHLLPNLSSFLFADLSLRLVYAIKSEAVLSYLGLGLQGEASWGLMIADAQQEITQGILRPFVGVTFAMCLLVFSLQLLTEAFEGTGRQRNRIS